MRLVIESRAKNSGGGLNRYQGRGIYKLIGRKVFLSGLKEVTKDEAETDNLNEKSDEKGMNAMEIVDVVDSPSIVESVKKSLTDGVGNFSEEERDNEDEESSIDKEEADINENKGDGVDITDLNEKVDDLAQKSDDKRNYTPSVIDFLINNNVDDASIPLPTKLQRLDSAISDRQKDNVHKITSLTDHDSHKDEIISEWRTNHQLTLIGPTERRRYPQKKCVYCRRKYGLRNDTRYICTLCDVALCKEPCFSVYHCNK